MSPEYKNIRHTPQAIKEIAKSAVMDRGMDYDHAVHKGFAFCMPNNAVTKVEYLTNLPEAIIADSKKQNSAWYAIGGLENPRGEGRKKPKTDEGDIINPAKNGLRGNIRSANRGKGLEKYRTDIKKGRAH
jgi:hypothetical protein